MKLNRNVGLLVAALASLGAGAAVATAAETTTPAAAPTAAHAQGGHHHWRGHHGGMLVGMTLRATRQLNLTAEQQASIKASLEKQYGAGLEITYGVVPALLGGLRIQVGSDLYDGSVQTRLQKLEQSF